MPKGIYKKVFKKSISCNQSNRYRIEDMEPIVISNMKSFTHIGTDFHTHAQFVVSKVSSR